MRPSGEDRSLTKWFESLEKTKILREGRGSTACVVRPKVWLSCGRDRPFFNLKSHFQAWFLRGTPPELSILPVFPWITHFIFGCCTKTFKMFGHSSLGLPCPDHYIPFLCIKEKLCTFIIDKNRNFLRINLLFGVREKYSTVLQISSLKGKFSSLWERELQWLVRLEHSNLGSDLQKKRVQ